MEKRKKLNETVVKCPVCGEPSFQVFQFLSEIPYFGEVLETYGHCEKCGYKANDVMALEEKPPIRQKVEIKRKEDLMLRFIKSSKCKIEIPELGIEIVPGPASEGVITNVEGMLERIENSLKGMKITTEKEKEIDELIDKIEKVRKGEMKITIIIEDESGNSKIIKDEGVNE